MNSQEAIRDSRMSLIRIAASMRIDLKNNLVPWKKLVPLRSRICEKSIWGDFEGDNLFTHYENITDNVSLKLIRYNNIPFMIL